jgi:F0F1-type ATP synthase membrane subunit b/b'
MPALVGLGIAVAAVALVWGIALLLVRFRREHRRRVAARRRVELRRLNSQSEDEPDPRATAVIRDAERALAEARREAEAIVAAAETRADQIAAEAEDAREALLARALGEAVETRRELSTLLHDLLAEVRRAEPERSDAPME